jgi:preprotein translocase subunit YajC
MFAAFLGGLGILFVLAIVLPLVLVTTVFWIWMLVDAIQNKGLSDGEKVGWVLALVFAHFLGALLYFFIGRPKRKMMERT